MIKASSSEFPVDRIDDLDPLVEHEDFLSLRIPPFRTQVWDLTQLPPVQQQPMPSLIEQQQQQQ